MKLITILNILSKYGLDEDYPLWAEHDIVGFRGPSNISQADLSTLDELGVFYSEEYDSLIMFV